MPQLDGLRALAVASVAFSHWVTSDYHFGLPWGTAGVQLFFVLSGFLITGILLRCREYGDWTFAARAFYARRFLRIFPLFYAVLLTCAVLNIKPVRDTFLWHVSYLSNFYFVWNQGWDGPISHFWSLAVEEQFYLFWPVLILCVPARHIRSSILALIATGIASRFLLPLIFPEVRLLSVLPNSNFDALGLGSLLAFINTREMKHSPVRWFIAGVPLYIALFGLRQLGFHQVPFHKATEHLAMLISFTWLIDAASKGFEGPVKKLLQFSPLLYLGRISYGLYVLHNFAGFPVRVIAIAFGTPELNSGLSGIALKTLVTIGGASMSWHFFEAPLNAAKKKFPYKKN